MSSTSSTTDPLGPKPWFAERGYKVQCIVTLFGPVNTELLSELVARGLGMHTAHPTNLSECTYVFKGEMSHEHRVAFDSSLRSSFAVGIKSKQIKIKEDARGHIYHLTDLTGPPETGDPRNFHIFFAALMIPIPIPKA